MSNTEIQIPSKFAFSTELSIRRIDLSLDLHVSFASILDLVMEAHLRLLQNYNFTPSDIFGKSVIFANANVVYQGELLFNDQVRIEATPDNFLDKGFDYIFRLTKQNGTVPIALVKIRVLFFDYSIKKVVRVPEEFKALFPSEGISPESNLNSTNTSHLWKSAHQLVLSLYAYTSKFPKEEIDHLTNRIRKSAISLPLAIMEGLKKKDPAIALKFYQKCRGHIEEIRYYLILANDLNYANSKIIFSELDKVNSILKHEFKIKLNSTQEIK